MGREGKKPDVEKERHWRKVIGEAARSGAFIRQFCRERGLRNRLWHFVGHVLLISRIGARRRQCQRTFQSTFLYTITADPGLSLISTVRPFSIRFLPETRVEPSRSRFVIWYCAAGSRPDRRKVSLASPL
jgi:hypothetical protein